jgi:16S rRNA (uracil1498-N3)-methyltransferase
MGGKTVARLHVDAALGVDATVPLAREQAHYLLNVLRMSEGADVLLFNGRDGEWLARLEQQSKKSAIARCLSQSRPQIWPMDITYAFAPLKHARLDYLAQKAAELGVAAVQPVITDRTVARKINMDRLRANLTEGAEQCGVMWVPVAHEPQGLHAFLAGLPPDRQLIICDENAEPDSPLKKLDYLKRATAGEEPRITVMIGPEGGFTPSEQDRLCATPTITHISLGPRIMRADTAAVAALSLVQAVVGDWYPR